ncbi:protein DETOXIFICATION 45, chloroplastic isoform X1 [Prunus persica]|uniref:protein DETOXIFICATION 45, chloroplastic isoform X1 n=1 Tax=Prunus persica TaxID=3760 RepID=UPI0009AB77AB|nr:protein DETOXIFICATION 45, chloroplastic isoform X1 [Prunus persica]
MAGRQGPVAMAAHQICIQVWLAVSLLTDAMAASGQALIATYLCKGEYKIVKEVADSVLKGLKEMVECLSGTLTKSTDAIGQDDIEGPGMKPTNLLSHSGQKISNPLWNGRTSVRRP